MAEPARTRRLDRAPAHEEPDEEPCTLLRYVEGPDGEIEWRETPLTPEDFLDPKFGDTMNQGKPHVMAATFLFDLLTRRFHGRPDVLVLHDVKHLMMSRRGPAPDVSVIMGLETIDHQMRSYNVKRIGIPPSLIIEVVSPRDRRIREVDEKIKPGLYERIGVREYLILDLPRRGNGWQVRWTGYRMDEAGRYQPIEPDAQARLFSETTGLLFGANVAGDWAELTDAGTGQRLLSSLEEQEGRLRAEEELRRETERRRREAEGRRSEEKARKAAEAEVARLREELRRLRGEG
ncbi:MAG TPA: Uma2 family endonuclease [Thermoanaerobaculia bacterium]|nr:Uma2 family endonuclease [Thermoanaerobaculia bacterium]